MTPRIEIDITGKLASDQAPEPEVHVDAKRTVADEVDSMLPAGWDSDAHTYGMAFNLICPHGHTIEQDGECPEGCVSPLRRMGLI